MSRISARRVAGTSVAAIALSTALAGPAFAHVTVSSASAAKGGFSAMTFRVPTEKDNASTTKVQVAFPTDTPLASVSVKPVPGWTAQVAKTKLATPISSDDGPITDAVSQITWTASSPARAVHPGEYQEFGVSAGPLPTSTDALTFKALQTYSDGSVVRWIDTQTPGGPEAEHPAPTLKLAAAADTAAPAAAPATRPRPPAPRPRHHPRRTRRRQLPRRPRHRPRRRRHRLRRPRRPTRRP